MGVEASWEKYLTHTQIKQRGAISNLGDGTGKPREASSFRVTPQGRSILPLTAGPCQWPAPSCADQRACPGSGSPESAG
jgi:hypothetical protein